MMRPCQLSLHLLFWLIISRKMFSDLMATIAVGGLTIIKNKINHTKSRIVKHKVYFLLLLNNPMFLLLPADRLIKPCISVLLSGYFQMQLNFGAFRHGFIVLSVFYILIYRFNCSVQMSLYLLYSFSCLNSYILLLKLTFEIWLEYILNCCDFFYLPPFKLYIFVLELILFHFIWSSLW